MTRHFLRFYRDSADAQLLLICLPHAGGAASAFRAWPALFDGRIAVAVVQYPGREDRYVEAAIEEMPQLVDMLVAELLPQVAGRRFALLGHSMGGAIAHELALRLSEAANVPECVFISGRQPPCFHPRNSKIHCGSDADILAELRRLSPENQALVESPELAALMVPIIRSDYRLIECYQPAAVPLLRCPIEVLVGRDDSELPTHQAHAWANYTSAGCQVHFYPGGHFFITHQRSAVVDTLKRVLQASLMPIGEG